MAHHNEESEFNESKWVKEQGALLQVSVLEEDVSERLGCLDLFLLNQAISNTNDCFLHLFGQINSVHQKRHIILFQVQSIICDPKVIKQAVVHISDTSAELILLAILLILSVGIVILAIVLGIHF